MALLIALAAAVTAPQDRVLLLIDPDVVPALPCGWAVHIPAAEGTQESS